MARPQTPLLKPHPTITFESSRQHRLRRLMKMRTTVQQLEKEYAKLCEHSSTKTHMVRPVNRSKNWDRNKEAVAIVKRLGAEKLLLQSMIQQKIAWEHQLQCVSDFDQVNTVSKPHFQSPNHEAALKMLNAFEAKKDFGISRLTEQELTRLIQDNKRVIHEVETRLLFTPSLESGSGGHTCMQAFGWKIAQRVEGGVMEFSFTKKFTGLSPLNILQTTWLNDMQPSCFKNINPETQRQEVVQEMTPNAVVLVRDVTSTTDMFIFRSIFARFLVKATCEITLDRNDFDAARNNVIGTGYLLGTHSLGSDSRGRFPEKISSGNLSWANLTMSIGVFDVVDPTTGEKFQHVRWAGRTDYCSEEHARRNATDTLHGMLRWEMLVIAPALNIH